MVCCICLKSKRWYQEIRELKCGHRFHFTCINKWTKEKKTCPQCRIPILQQNIINIFDLYTAFKGNHSKTPDEILLDAGIENKIIVKPDHSNMN